jgi:hypothetical protein
MHKQVEKMSRYPRTIYSPGTNIFVLYFFARLTVISLDDGDSLTAAWPYKAVPMSVIEQSRTAENIFTVKRLFASKNLQNTFNKTQNKLTAHKKPDIQIY